MGFTSDACWFLLIKTLLIKNNKKREAALKNEAGGDEKDVFFLLGLIQTQDWKTNNINWKLHRKVTQLKILANPGLV